MRIKYMYTYIPSLPRPTPPHSSRLSQSTELGSLCYTAASHWLSISHRVCISTVSIPLLSILLCIQKSVLYICITISVLQIGSSAPFF